MHILTDLIFLLVSAVVSLCLYPIWINFVYKFQMGEDIRAEGPQTHLLKRGTPTMGGMVFVLVVAILTFIFNRSRTQTLFPLFIALLAGLLGVVEDFTKVYKRSGLPGFFEYHFNWVKKIFLGRFKFLTRLTKPKFDPWALFKEFWRVVGSNTGRGIKSHQKFLVQALMGSFVAYWTYFKLGWDYIWFPLMGDVHIGIFYPLVIFGMFIVILNFVAVTDGLDGLLGGLSLFIFLTFWVLSGILGYNSLATFCAVFVGSLIPFLYFNVYPARVFMGDVGSHVLGAVMVTLAIVMHREIAFLIIAAVPIFDGLTSPLQQLSVKLTGKRIFKMAPVHHHFEVLGWPESKVTFRFWLFGIFFSFLGLFLALL